MAERIEQMERAANRALYRVAPEFARSLGIDPEVYEHARWFRTGCRALGRGDTLRLVGPEGPPLEVVADRLLEADPVDELLGHEVVRVEDWWRRGSDVVLLCKGRGPGGIEVCGWTRDTTHPERP